MTPTNSFHGNPAEMTAAEFIASLKRLSMTQRDAALLLDLTTGQINRYAKDRAPVPRPIALLLASMERDRDLKLTQDAGGYFW